MNIRLLVKQMLLKLKGNQYNILSYEDTINELLTSNKSLSRFGDGELLIVCGEKLGFQDTNNELSKRLAEVLSSNDDRVLIGVPDVLNYEAFDRLTEESKTFWVENIYRYKEVWDKYINKNQKYASANVTRFYIRTKDKTKCDDLINKIVKLWDNKEVVVVEGDKTRFGTGNNILQNAKSVERVLGPAENAFNKYDEILEAIKELDKNKLYLLALGPTASVLAYDMAKLGYRAIDIGHLDLEYEWYLNRVSERTQIKGKYVNELKDGNTVDVVEDSEYLKQIIKRV